jgi:hypothetical protein
VSDHPEMFGEVSPRVSPAGPLVGRIVEMPDKCPRCGGYDAAIGHGRGPHTASVLCACGAHRGWLPRAACEFILATDKSFGAATSEKIIIRGALEHAREKKVMAMRHEYDNTNRGAIFRDDNKSKDTDRDYSGTINVGGSDYWISGWIKTSKKGTKFLSLSVKPKDEIAGSKKPEFDDAIPF